MASKKVQQISLDAGWQEFANSEERAEIARQSAQKADAQAKITRIMNRAVKRKRRAEGKD